MVVMGQSRPENVLYPRGKSSVPCLPQVLAFRNCGVARRTVAMKQASFPTGSRQGLESVLLKPLQELDTGGGDTWESVLQSLPAHTQTLVFMHRWSSCSFYSHLRLCLGHIQLCCAGDKTWDSHLQSSVPESFPKPQTLHFMTTQRVIAPIFTLMKEQRQGWEK